MMFSDIKEILKIVKTINTKLAKPTLPIMTNPSNYTCITGKDSYYRRIGKFIEFSGNFPPVGINIITDTISEGQDCWYKAEVIGWSVNEEKEDDTK